MPDPASSSAFPALFGRVMLVNNQHASVHAMLVGLRRLSAEPEDPHSTVENLLSRVVELRRCLLVHFAAEESDEYFGAIAADKPSLAAKIEGLRAEHRQIVDLLGEMEALAPVPSRRGELLACLERLGEWFTTHEQAETRLIQEFFERYDESGSD